MNEVEAYEEGSKLIHALYDTADLNAEWPIGSAKKYLCFDLVRFEGKIEATPTVDCPKPPPSGKTKIAATIDLNRIAEVVAQGRNRDDVMRIEVAGRVDDITFAIREHLDLNPKVRA